MAYDHASPIAEITEGLLPLWAFMGFDFALTDGNGRGAGLWSDGTTMWVSDDEDGKIYAYSLDSATYGLRVLALDFNGLAPHGNSSALAGNHGPLAGPPTRGPARGPTDPPHPPVQAWGSATDEQVTLAWKGNPNNFEVTGYRIEHYEGHRSGWHRLEAFLPAANQVPWDNPDILEIYVDTNVMPSAPYRCRIRSVNSQGIISRYTGEAAASALIVPGREAMKRTGKPPVKQASTTDRRPLRSASAQGLRCGGPGWAFSTGRPCRWSWRFRRFTQRSERCCGVATKRICTGPAGPAEARGLSGAGPPTHLTRARRAR